MSINEEIPESIVETKKYDPTKYLASRIALPDLSPYSELSQMVGLDLLTVRYYSPKVGGRKIWGGVVPLNELWRTGANSSTVFSTTCDIIIGEDILPAGVYSLYTTPRKETWEVHFNADIESFGISQYNQENDVLVTTISPVEIGGYYENFTVKFSDVEYNSTNLDIVWEKIKIRIPIKIDNKQRILTQIESQSKNNELRWDEELEIARFCAKMEGEDDRSLEFVNRSLDKNKHYSNHLFKAELLTRMGQYEEGVVEMETVIEILEKEKGQDFPAIEFFRETRNEWQKLSIKPNKKAE